MMHKLGDNYLDEPSSPLQELRTSERKTFGDCPQQWWWSYVEGLAPRRTPTALWFGAHWHDAMAAWYLMGTERGIHPAEYLEKAIDKDRRIYVETEEEEDAFYKAKDLAVAMGIGYVEAYGNDEQWEILAIESDHAVIFNRKGKPYLRYLFCMDGLYRDLENGQVYILEHKTAKAIKTDHLRLDNQAGSYYAFAPIVLELDELIKPGEEIRGIQYNFVRKAMPDERPRDHNGQATNKPTKKHYVEALKGQLVFLKEGDIDGTHLGEVALSRYNLDDLEQLAARSGLRVLGEVSKVQSPPNFVRPDPVFRTHQERRTQMLRVRDEAWYMEQMRAGNKQFPVIKTPGDHCRWCPFREMCELDEYDSNAAEGYRAGMMITRDPYQQYRKAA
jgi:hypothetical protein